MAQSLVYLRSEQARLLADISSLNSQLAYARENSNPAIIAGLEQRLSSAQELLSVVNEQIQQAQLDGSVATASAGDIVVESQKARSDDATTQNPQAAAAPIVTEGRINTNLDFGTDGPTRTLVETQAPVDQEPQALLFASLDDDGNQLPQIGTLNGATPVTTLAPGAGSGSDDTLLPNKNATKTEIDNIFNDTKIIPQANVLDQYASYTYQASVYLMKPEALADMIKNNKKTIAGSQLLFQSGGAPVQGRNPYFSNDYYIEKIQLKSSIAGKGSNTSHNVNTISMTVVEPNGITLVKNLDQAVQSYLGGAGEKSTKKKHFSAQLYLLVIRFYGYDESGNLIQAGINTPSGATTAAPSGAFVEKYYPMVINNIRFKVNNKLVEYEIDASAPKYVMNTGQMRATIPYNVEISAMTVKEALVGAADVRGSTGTPTVAGTTNAATTPPKTRDEIQDIEGSSNPPPAPPTASAAPNPKLTVRKGLIEAMNQYQLDLVKSNIYTYPDVYSIEFVTPSIEQALIKKVGGDKKSSGQAAPVTAKDQLDKSTQSYDPTTRIVSATAGTQLAQFIDQILRNSSYIEDQQLVKVLEDSGIQVKNGSPAKNLAWYKISLEAIPIRYDPKRNDYAYNMKYIIHPYRINEMVSNYFANPTFKGVHKQYNYWFTGENTQVLSYEQSYNSLYTAVLSGGPSSPYNNQNDQIKFAWQTRSNESSQGASARANEPAANAADYLYNASDLAVANMTIVGDPAWLQQGEAFAVPPRTNFNFNAFLADGTINYESQQILFEILINTPSDYNLNTGLMDPNAPSVTNPAAKAPGSNRQSYVYRANTIVSDFVKGKFTQQLNGSLISYFKDQSIKTAQDSGRSTTNTSTGGASTVGGSSTSRSNTNNAGTPDNEWTETNSTDVETSEVPPESPDQEEVLVETGISDPQPAPDAEPPTSDGDISPYGEQNDFTEAGVNIDSQFMAREA